MNKLPIISRGHHGGIDFQNENKIALSLFLYLISISVFIFFVVLVLRLFQLTVVKGEYYKRIAEGNRIREVIIEPQRGTIIDRKGIVIADNFPADLNSSGMRLISPRRYTLAEELAPMIGYRQTADAHELKQDSCLTKLRLGDKVGKKGVEKVYECDLRGQSGRKLLEVDANGKPIRTVMVIPVRNGTRIQLAVDSVLQQKAYEIIKGKRAVVVGLKPQTGEVLLLASTPSYNPQDFEDQNNNQIRHYLENKEKPLFNRATEGTYPPGSVFKIVVAAGALEDKKVDRQFEVEDTGKIQAGPIEFGNWYFLEYGKTEGLVNMIKAIRRSNDIYFYKVGEKMGELSIKLWAEKFGYGQKTGVHLDEAEGVIPSGFWKEEVLNEQWYLGDTYNLAIGQGYVLVTPLQVALSTTVIANDGYLCKPKLLKVGANNTILIKEDNQAECKKVGLSKTTLETVKQGMVEACSPGGTGWPLFEFTVHRSPFTEKKEEVKITSGEPRTVNSERIPVACKTGTAESHAPSKIPHAWFTVYAPAQNPEIVLTVLVEEGGQGSDVAAPIAKEILKAYFERRE